MTQHQNGRIPLDQLTVTSIGVRLRADAAASVERMAPRFRREVGHALLASDGYRAKDGRWGQIEIFEDRYPSLVSLGVADRRGPWTRTSHPSLGARWWYRRKGAAAAAVPGTSNHGWGLACDFAAGINSAGTAAHRWMNTHGPEFGWIWPAWARKSPTFEPWHREYDPARDQHRGSGGGAAVPAPTPTPPSPEEDDMFTDADRKLLTDTLVAAQTAMKAADIATNAANRAAKFADDAGKKTDKVGADVKTVANEVRHVARAVGHPVPGV